MNVFQHLRFILRSLARSPAYATLAILVLAIGIGANTAVFSIIDPLVLRPLPFEDPDELYLLWYEDPSEDEDEIPFAPVEVADLRARTDLFAELGAFREDSFVLTGGDQPEWVRGGRVSPEFFPLLGIASTHGRGFLPDDGAPVAAPVALVSHGFWQRRLSARTDLGSLQITIDGRVHDVVGVLPSSFDFPSRQLEIWVPLVAGSGADDRTLAVMVRLRPGIDEDDVEDALERMAAGLRERYPDANRNLDLVLRRLRDKIYGDEFTLAMVLLFGAVLSVLMIACVNAANLFLARATGRYHEVALRSAIGAGRFRIFGLLLSESCVIGLLGGLLGVGLGALGLRGLLTVVPPTLPGLSRIDMDGRVLAFSAVLAVVTGLIFGSVPALRLARVDLASALKQGSVAGGARGRRRLRNVLVVSQIALTIILLIAAGLLIRSFGYLRHVDPGYDPDGVLIAQIPLAHHKYPDAASARTFYRQIEDRLETLPGVESLALVNALPSIGPSASVLFRIEGDSALGRTGGVYQSKLRLVTPGYFRALGVPVAEGRAFLPADRAGAEPVIMINRYLARALGDDSVLGRGLVIGDRRMAIVGVAGDVYEDGVEDEVEPIVYHPFEQAAEVVSMSMVLRAQGDPRALIRTVRDAVRSVDPDQPLHNVTAMRDVLEQDIAGSGVMARVLTAFALVAVILAGVGIYGVLAYTVAQNRRELGIRVALGATPRQIIGLVVGQGLRLWAVAAVVGLLGAWALMRLLSSAIYGVASSDPAAYLGAAAATVMMVLLAALVPALRANRTDAVSALRME